MLPLLLATACLADNQHIRRIVLLLIPITHLGGCCMYGGPGCADPAVVGICAGPVPLGESVVTLNYSDDTGLHETAFECLRAGPGELLSAEVGDGTGEVVLVGHDVGHAWFRVGGIPGWDESAEFQYSVKVVERVVESACDDDYLVLHADRAPAQ